MRAPLQNSVLASPRRASCCCLLRMCWGPCSGSCDLNTQVALASPGPLCSLSPFGNSLVNQDLFLAMPDLLSPHDRMPLTLSMTARPGVSPTSKHWGFLLPTPWCVHMTLS